MQFSSTVIGFAATFAATALLTTAQAQDVSITLSAWPASQP